MSILSSQKKTKLCPDFGKPCLQDRCEAWMRLIGKHPQTGQPVDEYRCSKYHWVPILLVELRQSIAGVQEATESFRNEVVKREDRRQLSYDKAS